MPTYINFSNAAGGLLEALDDDLDTLGIPFATAELTGPILLSNIPVERLDNLRRDYEAETANDGQESVAPTVPAPPNNYTPKPTPRIPIISLPSLHTLAKDLLKLQESSDSCI